MIVDIPTVVSGMLTVGRVSPRGNVSRVDLSLVQWGGGWGLGTVDVDVVGGLFW